MKELFILTSLILVMMINCLMAGDPSKEEGNVNIEFLEKLVPLYEPKLPPGPYDWMSQHREPAQTLFEYMKSRPVRPTGARRTIYIALLGEFDPTQKEIIQKTARYIEAYFGLPVKWVDPLEASLVPAKASRVHPQTGDHQMLTRFILEEILKPRLPEDAMCLIAFTAFDLWPEEGWNFVFGEASIEDRVGVWSIYRNGNPQKSLEEKKLCLLRTIKTGTHEIAHMFSLPHCPFYECNMNGSNHRVESDRRPTWLCPVCLGKLLWNTREDPAKHFSALIHASDELHLKDEMKFYERSLESIK